MLLEIKNLKTYFRRNGDIVKAVDGVSFSIAEREVVGLVGESGCGKSTVALSILKLIQPPGEILSGEIIFKGKDILKMDEDELLNVRGGEISIVFQEPASALNPVFRIGNQIAEAIMVHQNVNAKEAKERTVELLKAVKVPAPAERINYYPHQLSGGQKQRALIAMALASNPSFLILDEPTTALDVTTQLQILELIKELKDKLGLSILWITHDLNVVAEMAERVIRMEKGKCIL